MLSKLIPSLVLQLVGQTNDPALLGKWKVDFFHRIEFEFNTNATFEYKQFFDGEALHHSLSDFVTNTNFVPHRLSFTVKEIFPPGESSSFPELNETRNCVYGIQNERQMHIVCNKQNRPFPTSLEERGNFRADVIKQID